MSIFFPSLWDFDMETEAVAERLSELENNQTLGLLMGFLAADDG